MVPSITPNWMSSSVSHAFSAFSIFSLNPFSKRLISASNSSSCASNCSAKSILTVSTLSRWIALVLVAAARAAFLLLYFLGSCWCLDSGAPFSSFLKLTFLLVLLARCLVVTCPRAIAPLRLFTCSSTWQGGGTGGHSLRWIRFRASSKFIPKLLFTLHLSPSAFDFVPVGSGLRHP